MSAPNENQYAAKDHTWVDAMIERESTPKAARKETIAEFSARWGISDSTYNYQKNRKENKKRIVEVWLNEACDGGNEVLAKLKQNALEGKEKSIEMYLKFVLELAENLDLKSDGKPIVFQIAKEIAEKNNINETDNFTSGTSGDSQGQA